MIDTCWIARSFQKDVHSHQNRQQKLMMGVNGRCGYLAIQRVTVTEFCKKYQCVTGFHETPSLRHVQVHGSTHRGVIDSDMRYDDKSPRCVVLTHLVRSHRRSLVKKDDKLPFITKLKNWHLLNRNTSTTAVHSHHEFSFKVMVWVNSSWKRCCDAAGSLSVMFKIISVFVCFHHTPSLKPIQVCELYTPSFHRFTSDMESCGPSMCRAHTTLSAFFTGKKGAPCERFGLRWG